MDKLNLFSDISYYNVFMAQEQVFKAVYFPGQLGSKNFTLAFSNRNKDLYKQIAGLKSQEIRELLGTHSFIELENRALEEGLPLNTYCLWYLHKHLENSEKPVLSKNKEREIASFQNKVIEGDCMEVMQEIPSKSIDMVLCDLPYGTTQNHWDSVLPLDELWKQYERVIKDNGTIALTGQGIFTAQLILSNQKLFKYKIVWMKSKSTNFLNAKKQPLRRHEDICIFYKNQPTYNPQMSAGEPYNKGFRKDQLTGSYGDFKTIEVKSAGERYPTDVVYFKTAESEGEVFHPTQKPIELGRYLIRTFTQPGEIILDNTCGSGSFLVSAILEDRKFIGIEKNQEVYLHRKKEVDYIEICKKRIKEAREGLYSQTREFNSD